MRAAGHNPASAATVVVVDESPALLELAEQALRERGHRVVVTRNPHEALELAARVRVDLIVGRVQILRDLDLDLDLDPGSSGRQVLEIVPAGERSDSTALREPFSLLELQDAVAGMLSG